MKIISSDAGNGVLDELCRIKNNEKWKPVNIKLFDRGSDEKDIVLNDRTAVLSEFPLISAGSFFEACKSEGKRACMIIFCAHAECAMIRGLAENGFPAENLLLIGAGNLSSEEIAFLSEKRIRLMNINQIEENIAEACEIIMEFASGKELYLRFNLDIIDSGANPGGMSARQAVYIISRMAMMKNLRVFSLGGFSEREKLGAKLVSEIV